MVSASIVGGWCWALAALPAAAHPPDPADDGLAHAQQDLVGRSVTEIERATRANAAAIRAVTGAEPGSRAAALGDTRRLRAAVSSDPGRAGRWDRPRPTEVVPVFQALLPSGRVLIWDSVGDGPAESTDDHSFTRAMVWNPADNSYVRRDLAGYNIFCAGYVQLADGNVLVAGGNKNRALEGIAQTHLFDWRTETWSRGPDMSADRWYPSVAALASGEAAIVAGGSSTAEVYQLDRSLRRLTGFTSFGERLYPFLVPRPDGQLQLVGPRREMSTTSVGETGALTASASRDGISRAYGSFATYDVGKTLVAGGGSVTENGQSQVPTRTAVVVDTTVAGATGVTPTSPMALPRRQFSLTALADGSVLATGGETRATDSLVDLQNAAFAAERWDPATGSWTTLAAASRVRQYHSTALLLPDGRVLTGGGGICGVCATKGYLEKNVEYFSPPYLFRHDRTGRLAIRPVVTRAPSVIIPGRPFAVTLGRSISVAKVGLVRLGAPTHGVDQGQRYVPLTATASGTGLSVVAPATAEIAPPGYYLLFVVDKSGTPSVARIVRLDRAGTPVDTGPR